MIKMTSITGALHGFYSTAFITLSGFSSGQDQPLCAGIVGVPERNSKEHVHDENGLMHRESFQEEKGFMLHCALSVWR